MNLKVNFNLDNGENIVGILSEPNTYIKGTILGASGIGGVKEMGFPILTEQYKNAGYRSIIFDYRGFGESSCGSVQKGDVNFKEQRKDYEEVYNVIRKNFGKVVMLGYSYSGSHAINMMANHEDIEKGIIIAPFCGMLDYALTMEYSQLICDLIAGINDSIRKIFNLKRKYINIKGGYLNEVQGENYLKMASETFDKQITASEVINSIKNNPKKDIKKIKDTQQAIFTIALKDSICPHHSIKKLADQINSKINYVNCEHTEVFTPEVAQKHIEFLET